MFIVDKCRLVGPGLSGDAAQAGLLSWIEYRDRQASRFYRGLSAVRHDAVKRPAPMTLVLLPPTVLAGLRSSRVKQISAVLIAISQGQLGSSEERRTSVKNC